MVANVTLYPESVHRRFWIICHFLSSKFFPPPLPIPPQHILERSWILALQILSRLLPTLLPLRPSIPEPSSQRHSSSWLCDASSVRQSSKILSLKGWFTIIKSRSHHSFITIASWRAVRSSRVRFESFSFLRALRLNMLPQCQGPVWAIDDLSRCFQRKWVYTNGNPDRWNFMLITRYILIAFFRSYFPSQSAALRCC